MSTFTCCLFVASMVLLVASKPVPPNSTGASIETRSDLKQFTLKTKTGCRDFKDDRDRDGTTTCTIGRCDASPRSAVSCDVFKVLKNDKFIFHLMIKEVKYEDENWLQKVLAQLNIQL